MLKDIQQWLGNPKRKYAEGLSFFNSYASKKQKENFALFLNDIDLNEPVSQFDKAGKFPILINQVVYVEKRLKSNPELFVQGKKGATEKQQTVNAPSAPATITLDTLPESFQEDKARIKEIIPIMAKLHAEMANNKLPDDKRLELVKDLLSLDDERRAIWARVDEYANGNKLDVIVSEEETVVRESGVSLGIQLAKKIDQLKEKIGRNEESIRVNTKNDKPHLAKSAEVRLVKYRQELKDLQKATGNV